LFPEPWWWFPLMCLAGCIILWHCLLQFSLSSHKHFSYLCPFFPFSLLYTSRFYLFLKPVWYIVLACWASHSSSRDHIASFLKVPLNVPSYHGGTSIVAVFHHVNSLHWTFLPLPISCVKKAWLDFDVNGYGDGKCIGTVQDSSYLCLKVLPATNRHYQYTQIPALLFATIRVD
jgi:hypothetical protein